MLQQKTNILWCLFTASIILVIYGCTHNAYTATNRSYKQQAKAFAKELSKQPEAIDSTPAPPYWVGTTNFGMRKPNFVVIHHTAQHACDSTLRTFTLTRTQVSAHVVGHVSEIPPGARKVVEVEGRSIGVFNVNGALADPILEVIPLGGTTAIARRPV